MHVLLLQRAVTLGLPSRSPPIQVLILMTFEDAAFKTRLVAISLHPPSEPEGRGIVGQRWHPTVLQAAVDTSVMLRHCRPDRILAKLSLRRLPRKYYDNVESSITSIPLRASPQYMWWRKHPYSENPETRLVLEMLLGPSAVGRLRRTALVRQQLH